jgi:Pyruvate/2-oxoacid:ferredoxin oxidoreductase delta subunit
MAGNHDVIEDPFLCERLERVDGWLRAGKVPFSSRVIAVGEVVASKEWVLPAAQVLDILRGARTIALSHCICRTHYRRCDHPTEVCLLLDEAADRRAAQGSGRYVSLEEAAEALRRADERGLVHLAFYDPEQPVLAVCSCCACCCHDLQLLRRYGRHDLIARSEYVSATDPEACTDCGDCSARCPFGARVWDGTAMRYDAGACYGCGVCVAACAAGAIRLERRGTAEGEARDDCA